MTMLRQIWWENEKSTWPNRQWSRFVTAAGLQWHVQQMGSGPNLLLLHGTGASTHSWRDVIQLLAQHFTVLAIDLPGHGFTDGATADRMSIEGMSRSVGELLRVLNFEPAFVVGHSAGAVILCRMALDELIAPTAIVSVNGAFLPLTGASGPLFSGMAQFLAKGSLLPGLLARFASSPMQVRRILAGTGSRLDAGGIDLYRRLVRNPAHVSGALAMMSHWNLANFAPQLVGLDTPLILMVGSADRTVPPGQAREIARRVKRATVVSFDGLGHLAHEENPALVTASILKFCRTGVNS